MICVYPADCIEFATSGNVTLALLFTEVMEARKDEQEGTLVYAIDKAEGCIKP